MQTLKMLRVCASQMCMCISLFVSKTVREVKSVCSIHSFNIAGTSQPPTYLTADWRAIDMAIPQGLYIYTHVYVYIYIYKMKWNRMRSTAPEKVLGTTGRRAFAQHAKKDNGDVLLLPAGFTTRVDHQATESMAVSLFYRCMCAFFWENEGVQVWVCGGLVGCHVRVMSTGVGVMETVLRGTKQEHKGRKLEVGKGRYRCWRKNKNKHAAGCACAVQFMLRSSRGRIFSCAGTSRWFRTSYLTASVCRLLRSAAFPWGRDRTLIPTLSLVLVVRSSRWSCGPFLCFSASKRALTALFGLLFSRGWGWPCGSRNGPWTLCPSSRCRASCTVILRTWRSLRTRCRSRGIHRSVGIRWAVGQLHFFACSPVFSYSVHTSVFCLFVNVRHARAANLDRVPVEDGVQLRAFGKMGVD